MEKDAFPGQYFEHTGSLDWECQECRAAGIAPFQITTRGYENPRGDDYDGVLSRVEADHAVTCKGRLVMVCAGRNKMVRFDCHAELGLTLYGKSWNAVKVIVQKIMLYARAFFHVVD